MGSFIAYCILKVCKTKLNLFASMVQNNYTRNTLLIGTNFQKIKCVNQVYFHAYHKDNHKQVYDHYFEFFRKNIEYEASVVQVSKILEDSKIISGKYSVVFDGKLWTSAIISDYLPQSNEREIKLSTSEIKNILSFMVVAGTQFEKSPAMIKWLDKQCLIKANSWPLDFTLYILDAWYLILGSKAFKHSYFMYLTNIWNRKLKFCTKNNVIQMLYFIGLAKYAPENLSSALQDKLEKIMSELSDVEWAIVCISYFKSNTKLFSSLLLSNICKVAINFMEKNERFHLISVLKCLRHAQHHDEFLLQQLREYIIKEYSSFNFVECTHFLATFASVNCYDQYLFNCFEEQGVSNLVREEKLSIVPHAKNLNLHPSVRNRAKDVARFMWGLLSVGHLCKEHSVETFLRVLYQKFAAQEFRKEPQYLVDSLQSLAFIQCYPYDLLKKVLTLEFFQKCIKLKRNKPLYQLYFLSKSISVECPQLNHKYLLKNELNNCWRYFPRSLYKDTKEREGFEEIISLLKQYFNGDDDFKCCYIFPHIAIAGILVKSAIKKDFCSSKHEKQSDLSFGVCKTLGEINVSDELIHALKNGRPNIENNSLINDVFTEREKRNSLTPISIEVLDSTVCVHNSVEPLGLMKTKIRQLRRLSYHVVTLTVPEIRKIGSLSSSEMAIHLSSLLKL